MGDGPYGFLILVGVLLAGGWLFSRWLNGSDPAMGSTKRALSREEKEAAIRRLEGQGIQVRRSKDDVLVSDLAASEDEDDGFDRLMNSLSESRGDDLLNILHDWPESSDAVAADIAAHLKGGRFNVDAELLHASIAARKAINAKTSRDLIAGIEATMIGDSDNGWTGFGAIDQNASCTTLATRLERHLLDAVKGQMAGSTARAILEARATPHTDEKIRLLKDVMDEADSLEKHLLSVGFSAAQYNVASMAWDARQELGTIKLDRDRARAMEKIDGSLGDRGAGFERLLNALREQGSYCETNFLSAFANFPRAMRAELNSAAYALRDTPYQQEATVLHAAAVALPGIQAKTLKTLLTRAQAAYSGDDGWGGLRSVTRKNECSSLADRVGTALLDAARAFARSDAAAGIEKASNRATDTTKLKELNRTIEKVQKIEAALVECGVPHAAGLVAEEVATIERELQQLTTEDTP